MDWSEVPPMPLDQLSNLSKPKKAEIATHPFLVPIKDPKSEDEIDSLERGVLGENPEYYLA